MHLPLNSSTSGLCALLLGLIGLHLVSTNSASITCYWAQYRRPQIKPNSLCWIHQKDHVFSFLFKFYEWMTIWLEYFSFREFRLCKSIINVVKYLNMEQAVEMKSGFSRCRTMEQDKQEEWLHPPELWTEQILTGIDEIAELMSVWQPLILVADDSKIW